MTPPFVDGAIGCPSRGTEEIAGLDVRFADIVGRKRGPRLTVVASANGLVDIDMVGDGTPELGRVGEAALTHHPRHECRRPGISPARGDSARTVPRPVLSIEDPAAIRRDGPVAGNGVGDARRFRRSEPRGTAQAASRPGSDGSRARLVDDTKTEEAPFLNGHVDDAAPDLTSGKSPARVAPDRHLAGCAAHARGRRHDVQHVRRQSIERRQRRVADSRGGQRDHQRQNPCLHASPTSE